MLELQINAYWASRPGHFVMLNAHTLRETQQMTQQTLLTIAHALYEGNPQPILPTMKSSTKSLPNCASSSKSSRTTISPKRPFTVMSG
jgi:hypothetical protein